MGYGRCVFPFDLMDFGGYGCCDGARVLEFVLALGSMVPSVPLLGAVSHNCVYCCYFSAFVCWSPSVFCSSI